jgi:hypothetical protein
MRMAGVTDIEALLTRKRLLDARSAADPTIAARLQELRAWQASRLARTYADLRGDPRYAAAAEFFLSDVYGSNNIARRDADLERAWRYLKGALPPSALTILGQAVTLQVLSEELDLAMAELLPAGPLNGSSYASVYRQVGGVDQRRRQIDLLIAVGTDLDRIVNHAWIGVALRAAHLPAHAAGCGVLQDFLEHGAAAFRRMKGAREFLAEIRRRETQLMEALFSGNKQPFEALPAAARLP